MKGIKTFTGVLYNNGEFKDPGTTGSIALSRAKKSTLAYGILSAHNTSGNDKDLRIKFDALASHDITYVGIIQTARASGLKEFPLPYVLTNCHNSLCAVGGTINEDDHVFGLSAAKKYGGIFVPPHVAVIHQYMRECFAAPGKMILGSDSHTRYGALGCLAVGEGGPELVKQILSRTYDIAYPDVVGVLLKGKPKHGVGPQDVALSLIKATFGSGFAKNSVLEFIGDGISSLSMDFRIGIDVMTTETTCLSSVWETDEKTKEYMSVHGRESEYKELKIRSEAYYDRALEIDLSEIEPMIALPFHPSNAYSIRDFNEAPYDILRETEEKAKQLFSGDIDFSLTDKLYSSRLCVDQGVIAGCAGGSFENLFAAASILKGKNTGCGEFSLSVYPSSLPVMYEVSRKGVTETLLKSGTIVKTAFCGPCFGAGDVPCNKGLSIRHSTRNFPNREGSKPAKHQIASVALMDARSIAATAANKGILTSAAEFDYEEFSDSGMRYEFDKDIYTSRVYNGFSSPEPERSLRFGPGITDWPEQIELCDAVLLKFAAVIDDPVTTTDELIPSGETSSFRSDPLTLAEFTLSRKVPEYVGRAKDIFSCERSRRSGENPGDGIAEVYGILAGTGIKADPQNTEIGSVIYANKPGDGSAREQAASCQRVLGGLANIAKEYATKRYRSNLINWGMLPFTYGENVFSVGDHLYIPDIRGCVKNGAREIKAFLVSKEKGVSEITLMLHEMTDDERKTILCGCLANFYKQSAD